MHYCCEICICFSSTQTQGHTYTHAVEEDIPLWILSLSQSLLMDQSHNKKRQSHCQNQQMSSHSTAGALVSSLHREKTHVRERKRDREGTRERENWWWKRRVKEGEEGLHLSISRVSLISRIRGVRAPKIRWNSKAKRGKTKPVLLSQSHPLISHIWRVKERGRGNTIHSFLLFIYIFT